MFHATLSDDTVISRDKLVDLYEPIIAHLKSLGVPADELPRRSADLYYMNAEKHAKSARLAKAMKHIKQIAHEYKRYTYTLAKNASKNLLPPEVRVITLGDVEAVVRPKKPRAPYKKRSKCSPPAPVADTERIYGFTD